MHLRQSKTTGENKKGDLLLRLYSLYVSILSISTCPSFSLSVSLCLPSPLLMYFFSSFCLSLIKAFNCSLAHLSQGQSIKWRTSRPLLMKAALPAEDWWIHKCAKAHRHTHTDMQHWVVMCCCFPSWPPSLALAPRECEAKWWGFGAECSVGPFLMLSELPLGLTYA